MSNRDTRGRFIKGHISFVNKGTNKGLRNSPSTEFKKGSSPWNKGNGEELKCLNCNAIFYVPRYRVLSAKYCTISCKRLHMKIDPWKNKLVRSHSNESRIKISNTQRINPRRGELSPNWKGGTGTERHQAMGKSEYKDWRLSVFTRDNFICQICNDTGGYVHADHIESWADRPDLRYDINNGRTLCRACHYYITFKRKMPTDSLWGLTSLEK